MKKQNSNSGFGIVAFAGALAAAGAYFLYGTEKGKESRKAIRGWMLRFKGDVLEELEGLKEMNEEAYAAIVDKVSKKYQAVKSIDSNELKAAADDLKKHWKNIKKHLSDDKPGKKTTKK